MGTFLAVIPFLRADDTAEQPWIVEPSPEDPGAVKAGATEVERAQQLAKKKEYVQTVQVLEAVARKWPAATHDCNLSLAYLRAGALTRAQLMWDVAGLRNSARPNWCTGDLSTQVSTALRAAGYVPLTIDVVPADAVIEVVGLKVRGIRVLWLPTGMQTIAARAPGRVDVVKQIEIKSPSTRIQLELAEPVVEPPPTDAGVSTPPPADATVVAPPPDAAIVVAPPPQVEDPPRSKVPYIAGGIAALGWIGGATFYFLARSAADDANAAFAGTPEFDDAKSRFETDRILAYSLLGVGAVATGYLGYWFATKKTPADKRVTVTPTQGGAAVTVGGSW